MIVMAVAAVSDVLGTVITGIARARGADRARRTARERRIVKGLSS